MPWKDPYASLLETINISTTRTDEYGGNRESIQRMLKDGVVDRAKSCENHFYDCARRQEQGEWSSSSRVKFKKMIHELYHASTPGSYEAVRQKMYLWADEKPSKRGHIKTRCLHVSGTNEEFMYFVPSRMLTLPTQTWQKLAILEMLREEQKIKLWQQNMS